MTNDNTKVLRVSRGSLQKIAAQIGKTPDNVTGKDVDLLFEDNPTKESKPETPVQKPKCHKCGSEDCCRNGYMFQRAGKYQRYLCKRCGSQWKGEILERFYPQSPEQIGALTNPAFKDED